MAAGRRPPSIGQSFDLAIDVRQLDTISIGVRRFGGCLQCLERSLNHGHNHSRAEESLYRRVPGWLLAFGFGGDLDGHGELVVHIGEGRR